MMYRIDTITMSGHAMFNYNEYNSDWSATMCFDNVRLAVGSMFTYAMLMNVETGEILIECRI